MELEPFGGVEWVGEVSECPACGVYGGGDLLSCGFGDEALVEEVGEVVVGVLNGRGVVVGVVEDGVGGVVSCWHEAGVVEQWEFVVRGGEVCVVAVGEAVQPFAGFGYDGGVLCGRGDAREADDGWC